ncbi:MAG: N-acetylmuramoyl-L-alanine amidase [Balneolaceae bacterium]|nr:N-acetylmuramoyl-L-alanine amidase [Balneolaceae bacterium]MBO6546683.1 N-acetylmuramoyl-L-alanine amidase [Balneolaceae bacterium]MBO6649041.1 N-acetylmuramoyl-L-alanine amidase [Balneolaceae bacterium]
MTYEFNPLKRIQTCSLFRICAVLVFVFSLINTSVFAQPHLERISKAERSDGLGYVVRYHLSAPVDSFTVIQPAPDLIQMELFADNIDTTGIQMFDQEGKIQEVRLYKLERSYGVDIYLDSDIYVKSKAYPDQNGSDILLALTKADPYEVDVFTQQFLAKTWYLGIDPEEALKIESIPLPQVDPDAEYNQVRDKLKFDTIVIDAGHGGHDPGNLGYRKRTKEKDVVLAIALKLGAYINEYLPDVNVIYTRDDDTFVELEERGRIANRSEADLFVSIHADGWTSSKVYGSSVFFLGLHRSDLSLEIMKEENQVFNTHGVIEDLTEEDLLIYELAHSGIISTSERIAYMVEDQLRNRAGRKSRGVKQMGLVVLYQASMPGILVETGFLTNPSEQRFLTSDYGQSIMASAIFRAIRDYKVEYEKTETFSSSN